MNYTPALDRTADKPETYTDDDGRTFWRRRPSACWELVELVTVGWDGASRPIVDVRQACGCTWTRDGRARTGRPCSPCFAGAAASG